MTTKWNENDRVNFLDEFTIVLKSGIHRGTSYSTETKIQKVAEKPGFLDTYLLDKNFASIRIKKTNHQKSK